jgi:hypothetical protein
MVVTEHVRSSRPSTRRLVRIGALAGALAAVGTTVVAVVASVADVSREVDGEAIPIPAFAMNGLVSDTGYASTTAFVPFAFGAIRSAPISRSSSRRSVAARSTTQRTRFVTTPSTRNCACRAAFSLADPRDLGRRLHSAKCRHGHEVGREFGEQEAVHVTGCHELRPGR